MSLESKKNWVKPDFQLGIQVPGFLIKSGVPEMKNQIPSRKLKIECKNGPFILFMNSVCHPPLKLKSCHRWLSVKSVVIASNDKSSRAKGLKLHSQRHQVSHGPLVSWQRPSLRNTTCQDISNRKQAIPWETPAEPLYIILEEMLLVRLEWESWSADLWKKSASHHHHDSHAGKKSINRSSLP